MKQEKLETSPQKSEGPRQSQVNQGDPENQEDASGQYSFLKFHMVEDENATDESNNKSGDEGAGPHTAGAMR